MHAKNREIDGIYTHLAGKCTPISRRAAKKSAQVESASQREGSAAKNRRKYKGVRKQRDL
jgi:hypothetical protein